MMGCSDAEKAQVEKMGADVLKLSSLLSREKTATPSDSQTQDRDNSDNLSDKLRQEKGGGETEPKTETSPSNDIPLSEHNISTSEGTTSQPLNSPPNTPSDPVSLYDRMTRVTGPSWADEEIDPPD